MVGKERPVDGVRDAGRPTTPLACLSEWVSKLLDFIFGSTCRRVTFYRSRLLFSTLCVLSLRYGSPTVAREGGRRVWCRRCIWFGLQGFGGSSPSFAP